MQFDTLSSEKFHTIDMWNLSLAHTNNFKKVVKQLTQISPLLRSNSYYELKYVPFDNCML